MEMDEMKELILEEITRVEARIVEYREMSQPVEPDCAIGRVSRMDAINNSSVTKASLRQAESKLQNLNRVLKQIGTADFGKCIKCAKPIPPARILYRPESLTCVQCAH